MLNTTIDETLEAEFALRQRHPEREEVYDGHRQRSGNAQGIAVVGKGGDGQPDSFRQRSAARGVKPARKPGERRLPAGAEPSLDLRPRHSLAAKPIPEQRGRPFIAVPGDHLR